MDIVVVKCEVNGDNAIITIKVDEKTTIEELNKIPSSEYCKGCNKRYEELCGNCEILEIKKVNDKMYRVHCLRNQND